MPHGGQHPTEETMNITRKFLGGALQDEGQQGERDLPGRASPVAQDRSFGQQGRRRRSNPPPRSGIPPLPGRDLAGSFFDLPGPVGFAQTPQGQAILQRILGGFRGGNKIRDRAQQFDRSVPLPWERFR